jgi:hypothetical protein
VTRFNELKRIESAILHKNRPELGWARAYCEMRLQLSSRQEHTKYWRKIEARILKALDSSS